MLLLFLSSAIQLNSLKHAMFCSSLFLEGSNGSVITLSLALWVGETLHGNWQYREIQESVIWYTQITMFELWSLDRRACKWAIHVPKWLSYRLWVATATLFFMLFRGLCWVLGFLHQLTYLALGLKDFVAYLKYHYVILDLWSAMQQLMLLEGFSLSGGLSFGIYS